MRDLRTPLEDAIRAGQTGNVQFLMSKGANRETSPVRGRLAFDFCFPQRQLVGPHNYLNIRWWWVLALAGLALVGWLVGLII